MSEESKKQQIESRASAYARSVPYEKYAEIDLPHGCVIDLDLWDQVQKKLVENAGKKHKNLRLTRIYPLSKLLRFRDGSPFHGRSAWGEHSEERTHYYYNKNLKHPIRVEVLEDEVKEIVSEVIKKSPKLRDAIQRRLKDGQSLTSLLEGQIANVENQIEVLRIEKQKLNRRLDFLLEEGSDEDAKAFKQEYRAKMADLDNKISQCEENIRIMGRQAKEAKLDSFDWTEVAEKAQRIQDIWQENDPMALKEAYGRLFEVIVVEEEDSQGIRPLKFVLKDSYSEGMILADKGCVDLKLGHQSSANATSLKPEKSAVDSNTNPTDAIEIENTNQPFIGVVQAEKSCVEEKLG